MTFLHVYFSLRNQQAFQQLLDKGQQSASIPTSTSARKSSSWIKSSPLASADVNARDSCGRTVLHLACSSVDCIEYVRSLLRHSAINVNILDVESHWSPLHRALYSGNLQAAILLLQRPDIDTTLKDYEGYTAFDLYNSTVEGTTPGSSSEAELYTWGINRNATLALGDADDRTHPELVSITPTHSPEELTDMSIAARFSPVHVRQLEMSRLHTAVVTSENHGNVRVCGFGSGGRLGLVQHTQYNLTPINIDSSIVDVALGQDHTLALTNSGEVYSWGLNRFSQLGYVVESVSGPSFGRLEEPIQSSPKRIYSSLKKEFVRGVAASKMSSACWTAAEVFTWGTNNGQLGYDKAAQPVQILPRKVTKITKPVISVALSDSAMACLLETRDVICIWNDRSFKINFPSHGFPSEIQPYRPPQASKAADIAKIVCSDDIFAALSSNGELFTFSVPTTLDSENAAGKSFKPQRVWALRKQFSAVKDVAIGSEGSIIICTKSGHVFVRSRTTSSAKSLASSTVPGKVFKFQRIPFLQRVVKVSANGTGAFGALRVDYKFPKIVVTGNTMAQDFALIRPYLKRPSRSDDARVYSELIDSIVGSGTHLINEKESDDEGHDPSIKHDFQALLQLFSVLSYIKESRKNDSGPLPNHFFHGADLVARVGSIYAFPVHRVILAARSVVLQEILFDPKETKVVKDHDSNIVIRFLPSEPSVFHRLHFAGCHPMSVLILLDYIYTDDVPAIWDNRLSMLLSAVLSTHKTTSSKIKDELRVFARLLGLSSLTSILSSATKLVPHPTLSKDIANLHIRAQSFTFSAIKPFPTPDTILRLADKDVYCYSVVLRSRSSFFAGFFDDPDWTKNRQSQEGLLVVNFKHLKWHVMEYVIRFLCCDEDRELFDKLDFVNSVDDVLDFVLEVLAAANELLLDRLVLICSKVALQFSNIRNVCSVLTDATHFHALPLVGSLQTYMAANMETLLESRMLDMLSPDLIKQLSLFIQTKQQGKAPVTRFCSLIDRAMATYGDWLDLQDIPQPIIPSNRSLLPRDSPKLSPVDPTPRPTRYSIASIASSSHRDPINPATSLSQDDIFMMDIETPQAAPLTAWKATSTPAKVDMRAVMAEAIASERAGPTRATKVGHDISDTAKAQLRHPLRPDEFVESSSPSRVNSSPWKAKAQLEPQTPSPVKGTAFPKLLTNTLPRQKSQPKLANDSTPSTASKPTPASIRRTSSSSSKAWVTPATVSPAQTTGVSFATIQQEQLEAAIPTVKEKQSLLEIQRQEEDRRTEEEFLKWWAAEEERLRTETNVTAPAPKSRKSNKRRPEPRRHNADKT